ncbi:MAG: translation initiation factor IF-3 [candidate division WOR-3 bacterium]|nr:MAG: translation initiation factor IF-3 [candidate division WOR-3 bacterium]
MQIKQLPKVNREIRAQRVKIVDEDGTMLGEFHIKEAMRMARTKELDLVEVAPNAKPPVCRFMDFGRYVYEKKRQERESRKHQHRTTARGMRFSLKISEHDYQVKLAKVKEFLTDGDRVKISLRLRGREMLHADMALKMLQKMRIDLEGLGKPEAAPKKENNIYLVTYLPEKKRRT